jgi:hypothetical protein
MKCSIVCANGNPCTRQAMIGSTVCGFHSAKTRSAMSVAAKRRPPQSDATRDKHRKNTLRLWQKDSYQKNCSEGFKRAWQNPRTVENHRSATMALLKDPAWHENVARKTKEALNRPDTREKHLTALKKAEAKHGNVFLRVGKGRPPQPIMLEFAAILCPVGYLMDTINISKGDWKGASYYTLDFGHPEALVDIEIDGSSHKGKKDHDSQRDIFLRNLGWKVIRVKV